MIKEGGDMISKVNKIKPLVVVCFDLAYVANCIFWQVDCKEAGRFFLK